MRGGSLGGGLRLAVLAAASLGAAAGTAAHSVERMAEALPDGMVLRTGRDRGNGGHRGKPHLDGKRAKRKNRNHVSRRTRLAHRKARKA